MKKKLTLVVSLLLVMALSIGGTLAYLTDKTDAVTNTFTIGNVDITLTETDSKLDNDENGNTNSYKFVPGVVLAKDPLVTVEAGSESCYVFVQIDEAIGNKDNKVEYENAEKVKVEKTFADYFTYDVRDGWTQGKGTDDIPTNVYYRLYDAADANNDNVSDAAPYYILTAGTPTGGEDGKNGVITVKDSVTKEMVDALGTAGYSKPQLTFTAYAIQSVGFESDVASAWAEVSK